MKIEADWAVNPQPDPKHFCDEGIEVVSPSAVTITFNNN